MGVVYRYFSTSSAGDGDGTSWANRAALFSGGNWSNIITGFDFTSDSLECRIGPGTYTCTQTFQHSLFSTPPTIHRPVVLVGCDNGGAVLGAPDWTSDQPVWDTSNLPHINTTQSISHATSQFHHLKITSTASLFILDTQVLNWCYIIGTNNEIYSLVGWGTIPRITNCCLLATGTGDIDRIIGGGGSSLSNVRIEATSAGPGRRLGIENFGHLMAMDRVTISGIGIKTGIFVRTTRFAHISRSMIYGLSGPAIWIEDHTEFAPEWQNAFSFIDGCVLVQCDQGVRIGEYQIGWTLNTRLRDNINGNLTGDGFHQSSVSNNLAAGTDDDELVDVAGGDFRIKYGSALWGKGFGVSDEPAPSSGGGFVGQPNMRGGFQ
jgi:hypothetical protein